MLTTGLTQCKQNVTGNKRKQKFTPDIHVVGAGRIREGEEWV